MTLVADAALGKAEGHGDPDLLIVIADRQAADLVQQKLHVCAGGGQRAVVIDKQKLLAAPTRHKALSEHIFLQ